MLRQSERRWWSLKGDELDGLPQEVFAVVDEIKRDGGDTRRKNNQSLISLYENRDATQISSVMLLEDVIASGLTLNVCSSCVDVLASKIAPNRPKPQYLTVDGDFSEQMKAKNRQRFVMGNFQGGQVYKKSVDVFLDGGICDLGAMKLSGRDGKIEYERVFPNEILVAEKGAKNGDPRELFQEKQVPTDVLIARYPELKDEIERSAKDTDRLEDMRSHDGLVDDEVTVVEGWHLPSGGKAKDGRHVICVRYATLLEEEWTDDSFPFAFFRWSKRREGFYGLSLVEQLAGIQKEITVLIQRIRRAHKVLGVPWIIKPVDCELKEGSWTNSVGEIFNYVGQNPPKVDVHAIMAPEVYAHLDYLFNKAFEVSGISQLSAIAKKPAGVESGVALRTLLDTETQRFALLVDAWQEFFLELARQTVKQARRMGGATATWRMREWTRKISWSDVGSDDDDEKYVLQLWPVNLLPDTPAGKLAYVEQMITMGLLTPDQGQQLLDYPDIEAHQRTSAAGRDLIEMIVEVMLVDGRYIPPTKWMPLINQEDGSPGMGVHIVQGALLRGQVNGWPDERLELLERWLNEAERIAAPPPPAPAPGMMPPEMGMPLPPEGMPPEGLPPELAAAGGLPPEMAPPPEMMPGGPMPPTY